MGVVVHYQKSGNAINIYIASTGERLDWLCDEVWDLPTQISELEHWLESKGKNLRPNKYVADIGFAKSREAAGGGGVLISESMGVMAKIGMDIYFSEYNLADQLKS